MSNYYLWIYGPGIFGHLIGGAGLMLLCLYFLPSIVALARRKSNTGSIIVLNFFLGWTFIGWIVSLIWALSADPRPQQVIIHNNMPAERQVTPVMIRPANPVRPQQPVSAPSVSSQDKIHQLQQLKELLDNGVLTHEEFILQKSKILDS
jgi:Superinfection immunity protein/Short C-terminal domain